MSTNHNVIFIKWWCYKLFFRTALHLACVKGNKPIVQELLEWHAKPNIGDNDGKTPLLKVANSY